MMDSESTKKKFIQSFNSINIDVKKVKTNLDININYINGPFVELKGKSGDEFRVEFIDGDKVVHESTIKANMWTKANRSYFTNWRIKIINITENITIYDEIISLKDKRVYISFESKSLGDTLAWFPYADEFRKLHKCKLIVSTFLNELFINQYSNIEFVNPGTVVDNIFAQYRIGWFYNSNPDGTEEYNKNLNPVDFKSIPLQKTASDILGLNYKEIRPRLSQFYKKSNSKVVAIAINSTAQTKYWNNPNGWQQVVDYLVFNGYNVILYSKENDGYMGNFYPKGVTRYQGSLTDIINHMSKCDFFIGIGSGLSWLSWAVGLPTFIISGFSKEWTETTKDTWRIINKSVCNGCFNTHKLDPSDWNWCPIHKGTQRQFECSKQISSTSVIEKIEEYLEFEKSKKEERKISAYHILTDVDSDREVSSVVSISKLKKFGIDYQTCVNKRFTGIPPSDNCEYPEKIDTNPGGKLTPGHFGCYLGHKKAFYQGMVSGSRAILIFECDAVIDVTHEEFVQSVEKAIQILEKTDLLMFSFGFHNNTSIIEKKEDYYIVNKFYGAHAYLIPEKSFDIIHKMYKNSKWNVTDLLFAEKLNMYKIGIFERPITKQSAGLSILDKVYHEERY